MSAKWVGEALGVISVVASLLFVGSEIRQNTLVARGEARQSFAALQQEWLLVVAQDAELNRIWVNWRLPDGGDLTAAEASRGFALMIAWLRQLELVFLQSDMGLAGEGALAGYGITDEVFEGPRFRSLWEDMRDAFDPRFAEYLEERLQLRDGQIATPSVR